MPRLPYAELREVARRNGSVNVDLASYYELRWHDPFWLSARSRFDNASAAWDRTWPHVDFKHFGKNEYEPIPEGMPEGQAKIAQEYLDARTAYLAAVDLYANAED